MRGTRSRMLAELAETCISARAGMKSAERSSLGPSHGQRQDASEAVRAIERPRGCRLLAKVAAGEMASLRTLAREPAATK